MRLKKIIQASCNVSCCNMNKGTVCKGLCICNLLLFVQVDWVRTALAEFVVLCVYLAGLHLYVFSQVVNGVAVGTSQKAERLKPLSTSQACLWVFGFQGGKCQETQAWKEATEFGMCWYFNS